MNTLLMILTLLQPPQAPALIPDQAPPLIDVIDVPTFPTYDQGSLQAISQRKPLALFVGCEPRAIDGVISARSETSFPGYPQQCVIVSQSDGETWRATLSTNATDAQIRGERQVVPAAIPFVQAPEVADDSQPVRVADNVTFVMRRLGRWR